MAKKTSAWISFHPTKDYPPHSAGVYCIYFDDEIVYVGQSNDLYLRLQRHNFRHGYGGNIHTPWGSIPASISVIGKYKQSKKIGDWAMWEIRLINRLKPKYNLTYLGKKRAQA